MDDYDQKYDAVLELLSEEFDPRRAREVLID